MGVRFHKRGMLSYRIDGCHRLFDNKADNFQHAGRFTTQGFGLQVDSFGLAAPN
jgi:hypothetical protein